MSKNRVVHFEIGAEDPAKLAEFYKKAFDWEINEWGDSKYFMVGKEEDRAEGAIFGGIMKRYENEKTINTIDVEDLDKAISDVEAAGGKIVKPKAEMPIGEGESMLWCYAEDPQGNIFGLMHMTKKSK